MATKMVVKGFFFTFFLSLNIASSSGTLVGFSYDARGERPNSWDPREIVGLKNKVASSQLWVLADNPGSFVSLHSSSNVTTSLFLNQFEATNFMKSKDLATSWTHVSSIVVTGGIQLHSVLSTLNMIQSTIENLELSRRVKVAVVFKLETLKMLYKNQGRNLDKVMDFLRVTDSFVILEAVIDGELSLGDCFLSSTIARALYACEVLPYTDIPIVLNVKSSVVPSGVEIAEFTTKAMNLVDKNPLIKRRISGIFTELFSVRESEQKLLSWEEELIFHASYRGLLAQNNEPITATKLAKHDTVPSLTTPITVPSTTPLPGLITNPATTPVTIYPTNPVSTPITVPSTNPSPTPITVPATNPSPTPITVPATNPSPTPITVPATNPMPTPITDPTTSPVILPPVGPITNPAIAPPALPQNPPVTNPVISPVPPQGSTPLISPPATMPGTVPVSPTTSGQGWCVAKPGIPDATLQTALDYACGSGIADCSAIQMTGSCYNPSTLQAHASYAFNSYYQKNPVSTSCNFGGAATLASTNPSSGSCVYPSSSSTSGITPVSGSAPGIGSGSGSAPGTGTGSSVPGTGTGSSLPGIGAGSGSIPGIGALPGIGAGSGSIPGSASGSTVFNPNNSAGGSGTVFGADTPVGAISSTFSVSAGWNILSFVFTTICITGMIW